jgi:hypothetical protein
MLDVMAGLDPGIHEAEQQSAALRQCSLRVIMDCRVKPGNDAEREARNHYAFAGFPSATRNPIYRSSMA